MDSVFPSGRRDGGFPNSPGGPGPDGQPRRGFRGTADNAKTKVCTRWLQGDCRFGARCNFAHGEDELRKLPERGGRGPGGRGGMNQFGGPGRGYGGRGPGDYAGGLPGYSQQGGAAAPEDVWAAQGYPVQGPDGWVMYRARDTGEPYYHNHRTNETTWDQPPVWPQGGHQM